MAILELDGMRCSTISLNPGNNSIDDFSWKSFTGVQAYKSVNHKNPLIQQTAGFLYFSHSVIGTSSYIQVDSVE